MVYPRGDPRRSEHSVCRDYPQNPYQAEILKALGAEPTTAGFDFTNALALVIYGNGPWNAQGTRAVTALVGAGYPTALIQNYRGGLEDWLHRPPGTATVDIPALLAPYRRPE